MEKAKQYIVFLLVMAGCGGMLFDFGGTIINPAIPYLENLKLYTTAELSHLTSAVVMSAALAGLVAGSLAEWLGRKKVMLIAAAIAGLACLPICLVPGYWAFYAGRTLQGIAAGLIGVVVPMYRAECLDARNRGKGAGIFQFMDVIGILFCSLVGVAVVNTIGGPNDPATTEAAKHLAWKTVFWSSAAPAVIFFLGALGLKESPVWLEKKSHKQVFEKEIKSDAQKDSLLQRKYVIPFVLAVVILACNQATGCNAIQYFALKMFMDAGLGDAVANYANVALWAVMLAMTAVACSIVDK
ncbi:MAG: MFS transporter [Kiritimatiellae bacterium]|nr:MFS transporter [Kiritimatiellia bacterium]